MLMAHLGFTPARLVERVLQVLDRMQEALQ